MRTEPDLRAFHLYKGAFRTLRWGKHWHIALTTRSHRKKLAKDRETESQVRKMANRSTASSIDEYIAEFPPETQKMLEELRALIKDAAPGATETISYAIPTFDLNGHHLVHFAGYAKHIGFYPIPSALDAFEEELKPYKSGKGSAQLPLGKPLPAELIRRIVEFRVEENNRKASK